MTIKEHIALAPYTTFRVGGPARYFAEPTTLTEIKTAYTFAQEKDIPVFILGGGSNVLIQDAELNALVLHIITNEIHFEEHDQYVEVIADAGVVWDALVAETTHRNLWGIENLSAIPGSVGASAVQNIGAYGVEVAQVIQWVEVYDPVLSYVRRLTAFQCAFAYRDSIFKHPEGKGLLVMRVSFRLSKIGTPNLAYKDFTSHIATNEINLLNPEGVRSLVIKIRSAKLPNVQMVGTVGSFFMNPIVSEHVANDLFKRFPGMPKFPGQNGLVKLSAAYLIDKVAGLQGAREGDVGLWPVHALVIVNYGKATASEISKFASMIIDRVREKSGVTLVPEVVMIDHSSQKFH